jgi:hypothetical protein
VSNPVSFDVNFNEQRSGFKGFLHARQSDSTLPGQVHAGPMDPCLRRAFAIGFGPPVVWYRACMRLSLQSVETSLSMGTILVSVYFERSAGPYMSLIAVRWMQYNNHIERVVETFMELALRIDTLSRLAKPGLGYSYRPRAVIPNLYRPVLYLGPRIIQLLNFYNPKLKDDDTPAFNHPSYILAPSSRCI